MTHDLPSGLVTFLFTDIEGSTRLFRRLGDGYVPVLEQHNTLLRQTWAQHDGAEVKTEGDAFLVAFSSAASAIAAAVDAQQALAGASWPPNVEMRVRMGIHTGLAAPRDGDYVAYAVHQAARIVGAAHGGQIVISEAAARDAGSTHATLTSLGRFRIRDFDEPVELFRAVVPGASDDTRELRAVPATGRNFVPPPGSFVGRTSDVDALMALVAPGTLTTILGPGGVGKTRLAIELGLRLGDLWPDGVWLAELAAVADDGLVAGSVAASLGVSPGSRDPLEAIAADYAGRSAAVIIDNCEQVIESVAELVRRLIAQLPTIGIVTTSREPLNIAGERKWRVQPLTVDGGAEALFIERATEADPSFDPDPAAHDAIRRICASLEGIPLAIELAAARTDTLSIEAVELGLRDRFELLRSRRRDLAPRQRSMEALLEWSLDLLGEEERVAFRRLGAFAGPFTLKGAAAAATGDPVGAGEATDAVWALTDKSLLTIDGSANATRFAMSETVRSFARRLLVEGGEEPAVMSRIATWMLDVYGPTRNLSPADVSALHDDVDNIRPAIEALADHDPETAQLLAITLAYGHDLAGEYAEGVDEIDRLIGRLATPTTVRAVLLATAARLHLRVADHDLEPFLSEAREILDRLGPEPAWAAGSVDAMRAHRMEADGDLTGAIALAHSMVTSGNPDPQLARGYNVLGLLLSAQGDEEGSLEAHVLGLEVEERIGAPVEIAIAHNNIAEQSLRLGRNAEAARHQLETLELAAQAGSVVFVAFSLIVAARLEARAGRWSDSVHLHGAAERWLVETGITLLAPDAAASVALLADGRSQLGDEYEATWRSGNAMELVDAIETARAALRSAAADEGSPGRGLPR